MLTGRTFGESGNLYGTTENSETPVDAGSVFELVHSNSKWSEKVVHDFKPDGRDGILPYSSLIFDAAGNAYGTTYAGGTEFACGSGGCGTVFELVHTNGKWTEKVLHSFNLDSGGYFPSPGLVLDKAGNLYGATISGGDLHSCSGTGCGVVFQLINKNGAWSRESPAHLPAERQGRAFPTKRRYFRQGWKSVRHNRARGKCRLRRFRLRDRLRVNTQQRQMDGENPAQLPQQWPRRDRSPGSARVR